jgi:hypothetical protein
MGPDLHYSGLVLEHETLQHDGKEIRYSKSVWGPDPVMCHHLSYGYNVYCKGQREISP